MNKTVNINLAGIFFHIDEDAYLKLQRYLEAIKHSFTDSQGRSEIIADIEARIAELFSERVHNDRQVIGNKEVDAVITIMGQPEDYLVDDEIFEDEPQQKTYSGKQRSSANSSSKKLYRDTENSYVGGVSSGIGHYFGIDAIWIRLIWILLIFGAGTGVILYILLWIFVPEAVTTSEKIQMTGEQVNISNIEKKIKDGFDSVSTAVQNVDFKKHGDKIKEGFENVSDSIQQGVRQIDLPRQSERIKSSSTSFFEAIGNIFMFVIKLFAKFFGLILMFVGAVTLISLVIGFLSANVIDSISVPGINFYDLTETTGIPIWLMSILLFFFFGIIAFFIFYLGLKILISNMKSIGKTAKYTLIGLWVISFMAMAITFTKFGLGYKEDGTVIKTEKLAALTKNDTINVRMITNDMLTTTYDRKYSFKTAYDENDDKVKFSQGIRIVIRTTNDSLVKIRVERSAKGIDVNEATSRAEHIEYDYEVTGKTILLNNYFTLPLNEPRKDQEVNITLFIPEGSVLFTNNNTYNYTKFGYSNDDAFRREFVGQKVKIMDNSVKCLDCFKEVETKDGEETEQNGLIINEDGIKAKTDTNSLQIDEDGLKAESDEVKVNIDEDGIKITTDDN